MFFDKPIKRYHGDALYKKDLEEISNKINFLKEVKYNLLDKSKQILRDKNITCNNVDNFNKLTEEINKYEFNIKEKRPRFNGNVIDMRDEIENGELWLMAKAGGTVEFYIDTYTGEKYTVEWSENNVVQRLVVNNGSLFNKTAPSTGIDSNDKTFKYTIYKVKTSGAIKKISVPYNFAGTGVIWIVSKGIHFETFSVSYSVSHTYRMVNLEYIDILDGGTERIFAKGCSNLQEIEADYFHMDNAQLCNQIFYDCKKLKSLPNNTFLMGQTFSNAFYNCESLLELPYMDLSGSVNNTSAFKNCKSVTSVKNNTIKINKNAICEEMFSTCTSLLELPNIVYGDEDLTTGTNFSSAFYNCTAATKMPHSLNLSYCKLGTANMFSGCSSIIDGPSEILLYNNLNDDTRYSVNNMFYKCSSLRSIAGTITSANVDNCSSMFRGCTSLKKAPKSIFTNTLSCDYMYEGCTTLVTPPEIIDYPFAWNSSYMFSGCSLLQSAPITINLKTCLNASYMFNKCASMIEGPKTISLPASLSNVYMFQDCNNLINVGQEDAPIVLSEYADNSNMFINCSALKNVGDIQGGQNFSNMFSNTGLEKHPTINTNASGVTFYNMFGKALITDVDFNRINAPNAHTFDYMFDYCPIKGDQIMDLSKFINGKFFNYLFRGTTMSNVEITFPENTVSVLYAFNGISDLKTIVINILSSNVYMDNIYPSCNYLQSLEINGPFVILGRISNFTSTFFKTLKVNAPNWMIQVDHSWNFSKFNTLETCDMNININNYIQIINNKKLTDINLILNTDSGIKNNVVITLTGNALTEEALNKLMTNLPDINLIEKAYDDLSAELYIANNPGTATCDTSIATNKGWVVYTS